MGGRGEEDAVSEINLYRPQRTTVGCGGGRALGQRHVVTSTRGGISCTAFAILLAVTAVIVNAVIVITVSLLHSRNFATRSVSIGCRQRLIGGLAV